MQVAADRLPARGVLPRLSSCRRVVNTPPASEALTWAFVAQKAHRPAWSPSGVVSPPASIRSPSVALRSEPATGRTEDGRDGAPHQDPPVPLSGARWPPLRYRRCSAIRWTPTPEPGHPRPAERAGAGRAVAATVARCVLGADAPCARSASTDRRDRLDQAPTPRWTALRPSPVTLLLQVKSAPWRARRVC